MLDERLDVNATQLGRSRVLGPAVYDGHAFIVSMLLENVADLNYGGIEWHTIHAVVGVVGGIRTRFWKVDR